MNDEERMEKIRARRERRDRAGDGLDERVRMLIDKGPLEAVQSIARLYLDITGYLGEHMPDERESVQRFPCSGDAWHRCSFGGPHQQGCKAIGGDGELVGAHESAVSCSETCDDADTEPWCQCSGFDCPDCAMVDQLLALLAREGC